MQRFLLKNLGIANFMALARYVRYWSYGCSNPDLGKISGVNLEEVPMGSTIPWNGRIHTPKSLRLSHDEARAEFVRGSMEGGRIGAAATRLAEVCLPHFEGEEKYAFPVLGLLPDLMKGLVRQEMADVLPLISDFSAKHEALDRQHESIKSAIDELLVASQREKNRDVAEFAYNMRVHERIEDEVIYPTIILIGNYLRARLAM